MAYLTARGVVVFIDRKFFPELHVRRRLLCVFFFCSLAVDLHCSRSNVEWRVDMRL